MTRSTIRLLLVEDDASDAELVREALAVCVRPRFAITHATHLRAAIDLLADRGADLVLLDLGLPDSIGIETFERLLSTHPDVPCIVLTGTDDDDLGVRAVQRGAQDFVVKDRPSPDVLARSVRYAIERHTLLGRLTAAALEAQRGEARFRRLIERSAEGVLVVDDRAIVRFANAAAATLLATPRDRLLGAEFGAPPPGDAALETVLVRRDGTSFPGELRVAPLEWEGGAARLVSIHDLTDRKRAERAALAATVQRTFLPERMSAKAGVFDVAASNDLFEDVSGDFYDVVRVDDRRLVVAIGDVTGHGFGPALLMAQGRAYLRAFARSLDDLAEIASRMNEALAADMTDGRFMTLFFARLDTASGGVEWCNAGHVPALVVRGETGAIERLEATGIVLGIAPDARYATGEPLRLRAEDVLLLCSDGATEALAPDGRSFGEARIANVLRSEAHAGAASVVSALRSAIVAFTEGRPVEDDVTVLAVRRAVELPAQPRSESAEAAPSLVTDDPASRRRPSPIASTARPHA